jgi:hypothetical protein
MSCISYSAVVLDEKSKLKLIEKFKHIIPNNFEIIADHMTINTGKINLDCEKYLGLSIRLNVDEIAITNNIISVGVDGFKSYNGKPHIILAVDKNKYDMFKTLNNYEKIKRSFYITGIVKEVEFK